MTSPEQTQSEQVEESREWTAPTFALHGLRPKGGNSPSTGENRGSPSYYPSKSL